MNLDLSLTLILFLANACFSVLCGFMGARAPSLKEPRMIPWRFLMLISILFGVLLIVHVLTITGLKQDAPVF
jgi:hypothetical protein